ncbi:MAG: nitroreductase family protein [Bacteroidales bacterium]|nr:nitroreductase family protein [Bacteroidales bacterium]
MEFSKLITLRQSVRRYSDKPVESAKLTACLEAARMAPSASNSQPWSFVAVTEPGLAKKVAEATYDSIISFNKFVPEAPVIVALVIEKPKFITTAGSLIKDRDFSMCDNGIAAAHFCLQAAELGLGTCMLGWFNERKVKHLLDIPRKKRLSMLISLGYPPEEYKQREKIRKPFDEKVHYNQYKR